MIEDFSHILHGFSNLYMVSEPVLIFFFLSILFMATSSSSSSPLPLNTMVHMLTIKLTSSNYLLWRNQLIPLLTSQDLLGFLDGSVPAPSPKVIGSNSITQVNPAYTSWLTTDQTLLNLLYSSLTKESMSEVLGLSHAHKAWTTLEAFFSHRSKTRELQLKDELQRCSEARNP